MSSEIEKSPQQPLNNCILDKDTGIMGSDHNKEEQKAGKQNDASEAQQTLLTAVKQGTNMDVAQLT